jgi:lipopolysaccharide/colanic/teichoic acid biosynthesis glycosyltransferase
MILIDTGWPVFFLQNRVGENGRLFTMIKFRTMVKDAEKLRAQVERVDENGALIHKSRNDPRVTRSGRLLRRFSLDELPQLVNVIKGEMSLVGPRPELPYLAENYDHQQRRRLSVAPGLTGWWQVNGRSDRVMHLHTEDDIYYVENYSIWLDLRILIRTLWVVIIGKGAF